MGKTRGFIYKVAITLVLLSFLVPWAQLHAEGKEQVNAITEWQMLWEQPGEEMTIEQVSALDDQDGWFPVKAGGEFPVVPEHVNTAWIKFQLPELTQMRPALEINRLYGKDVIIYINEKVVFERIRNYSYDQNELMFPVSKEESSQYVYIKLIKNVERLGLLEAIHIEEFDDLYKNYLKVDLIDLVLGTALIFISFFMLLSMLFVKRSFVPGWNSLFLIMLSIGIMILSYSSFLDKYFPDYGNLFYYMFDISSAILIPSIFYFFELIFGRGIYGLITKFKNIQIVFSLICMLLLFGGVFSEFIAEIYSIAGLVGFGIAIILGNLILIISLINQCRQGSKEAIILSVGFGIFAAIGLVEMIWFFYHGIMYKIIFWKIGLVFFLTSLIIILVRRVMHNYDQAVEYSKKIEIFNEEIQRSEKIEMISHLAASIAHEVRNPLQVTRGFLQLLGNRGNSEKSKVYTNLAINELDRASEIITDFLTFAKPDISDVSKLDLKEELMKIEAILAPLGTMQGVSIITQVDENLYVRGNSSKFKQALINIIKNSIEASSLGGQITIDSCWTTDRNEIQIKVKDSGEGISKEDIKRLGEPYYSKKSKGTGLGLMVTYRIIEAMNGKILFSSEVGVGTEVCITFPLIKTEPMT